MRAKLRLAGLAGLALVALASPLWGPPVLRQIPWFGVRRVEISGTQLLAPHQVLALAGIQPQRNVWDDLEPVESAIRAHPAVAGVKVSRLLPHTIRIRVEEKRPIAYVEASALAPITARGEILPVDPARARMDLPVIRAVWAKTKPALRGRLLAETERLSRFDPGLLGQVSEIRSRDGQGEVLVLTHPLAEIILPVGTDAVRLAQLRAVLVDLERRAPVANPDGDVPSTATVDLRFREQIVVRLPSSV